MSLVTMDTSQVNIGILKEATTSPSYSTIRRYVVHFELTSECARSLQIFIVQTLLGVFTIVTLRIITTSTRNVQILLFLGSLCKCSITHTIAKFMNEVSVVKL